MPPMAMILHAVFDAGVICLEIAGGFALNLARQ